MYMVSISRKKTVIFKCNINGCYSEVSQFNTQVDTHVNAVVMATDDNTMVVSTPADAMIPSTPVDISQTYDVTLTPVISMLTPQRQIDAPSNTHLANTQKRGSAQDNYHDLVAEERENVKLEVANLKREVKKIKHECKLTSLLTYKETLLVQKLEREMGV